MYIDTKQTIVYTLNMIKSFKHKGLKKFFLKGDLSGISPNHADRLRLILTVIDSAKSIEETNFPGSRLHLYKNSDLWSVDVSGNWRILFEFKNQNAYIVDYLDPHK